MAIMEMRTGRSVPSQARGGFAFWKRPLRLGITAAVLGCALPALAQNLVANGTFTANAAAFTTWPGYVGGANPASVAGWSPGVGTTGGYGINGAGTASTAFGPANDGGNTYLFIQNTGNALAQGLVGMAPTTGYTLSFQAAARSQSGETGDAFVVLLGDSNRVYVSSGTVLPGNSAFQTYSYTFTTPAVLAGVPSLQISNASPAGDHTVDFTAVYVGRTRTTAATFTWTNLVSGNASGSWANQANWSGGTLPTIGLDTANFNTLDLTANSTVTLDGNQTINTLNFSDANPGTGANWILNAGTPPSSTLTLAGVNPAINVPSLGSGQAAVINAVVAGTNGFSFTGGAYLQLNGANACSGTVIISGADTRISLGNNQALGTGTIQVGGPAGDGQIWFNPAGNRTLANAMEIRTIRWIIDNATVNGVSAGSLTVNGNVLLNTGPSNVRDIYCNAPLTINGNVSVTPAGNPLNKNGGYPLTLNGTNTIGGSCAVNAGTLIVNGPLNGGATFTVNSGGTLMGTGVISGPVSVAGGGSLTAGSNGSGVLSCGNLTTAPGATLNFALGATNTPANGLIKVKGNLSLAGALNLSDLGGFSPGVYTGFQYSGSVTLNGLTNGVIPGGKTVQLDTSTPGYVLFDVLDGKLNPTAGENVPMDLAAPLALGWLQVPGAIAYDVYLGTVSNAVAAATTNTVGIYQGRTGNLTLNLANLLPSTTYYWRVDGVLASGALSKGVVYSFTTGAPMVDFMEDTWVATDALNRSLPGLAACGSPVTNRPVGMFYFLWHQGPGFGSGTNWDVSTWISGHPFRDPHNPWADNPIMQTVQDTYWWGQPALGYYNPSDPWVLRRQIALLTHAGVDVLIFDYSNAVTYDAQLYALCNLIRQMRFEGFQTNLKITFLTHANSGATATYLYNTLYAPGNYSDLWFYWQGKPLILGSINGSGGGDTVPSSTVQNFFTWRYSWAWVGGANTIAWIDSNSPQQYGYSAAPDHPESTPVTCGGWASSNLGHSYANNAEPPHDVYDLPVTGTQGQGLFFAQQMYFGLKYDPQFMYVTGWNEWIAGSYGSPAACSVSLLGDCCPAGGYYFVDEYDEEFSRDLEPMKGGHTDNYYFQMVGQNRLRKGVRPVPPASAPQTINLAGGFAQWGSVAPAYYDPVNDTIWRNYPAAAAAQMGTYTNNTGRNDFTVMKVARDAQNFYFFAQCHSNITSYTGSNWMVLFIDADQNHFTGWEGYDYAVNLGGVGTSTTTLYRNLTTTNGWTWTPVRNDLPYTLSGSQLMLSVPRTALGLAADPVSFDFHWADNFQTNDIADFGVNGDSAPDRRFNYCYTTTTNTEVVLLADDFESGKQSVWGATWTNGSSWSLTTNSPYAGNYCAVCSNGTGQSNLIATVSTAGCGSFRLSFHYKLNLGSAQNLVLYYFGANGWVPIRNLARNEYYPVNQAWSYNELTNVWLNFTDTRMNSGAEAQFFSTNFAFRLDGSAVTSSAMNVWVDTVRLTADTQMPVTPPPAWQTLDIGHAGNVGRVATNGATFTVTGSGLDIWNNGDAFRFVYQTRAGDGTLTARVTSQTASDPWAKAGVMIRELTDSGARQALTALTPSNNVAFQYRPTALGACATTSYGAGLTVPYWVRLVRSGTNLASYASANGAAWTLIGSTNLAGFNSVALWGLAVCAHNHTTNSTAVFDNVALTQTPVIAGISNQVLVAGQTLAITNTILNPDTPPRTLTWSLLSAPPGMTLDAASGLLDWRPTMAQSPTTNAVSLMVADNGTPSLSATQTFTVTVVRPAAPMLSALGYTNGQFGFTVSGTAGPDYAVLTSTNLVNWLLLQQWNSPATPFSFRDASATNSGPRFYRVQLLP